MFGQYDDAALNDALRAAGLFSLQTHSDESRLTVDSLIASGGGNLSVGQRQIIALARAIVRQSKLLILDEATSAIGTYATCVSCLLLHIHALADYETDAVIQSSLRNELGSNVTVITVAHRLQTIMDSDKIVSAYIYISLCFSIFLIQGHLIYRWFLMLASLSSSTLPAISCKKKAVY